MNRTFGTVIGATLGVVGLVLLALSGSNLSAQMDRADREGTAGNILALDVFGFVILGLVMLAVGVIVAVRSLRARRDVAGAAS